MQLVGLWDLSSLIRDHTLALSSKSSSPDHWATRELPSSGFKINQN